MKPIVSFDVDMTLLDHKDWTIPDSAMETLQKLRENYTIVLATGRDMDSSFSVVLKEQIRPDAIIHLNGTKITVGDTIIYEHLFDKELMKRILAYAQDTPYSVGASVGGYDYYVHPEVVNRHDTDLWGECGRRFADPWKLPELDVRTMKGARRLWETGSLRSMCTCSRKSGARMWWRRRPARLWD